MRPLSIPIELWPEVYRPAREPARPQPVLELPVPMPLRRGPAQEHREDEGRGVTIIDVLGD